MAKQLTKVITGLVRFSYASVLTPKTFDGNTFYSVDLLISKKDSGTIDKVKGAISAAKTNGEQRWPEKFTDIRDPLHDGDEEKPEDENYQGCYFLKSKSNQQPTVVDKDLEPIESSKVFYSGCYGRASVNFYAYNKAGNQGVGVGLSNVQKLREGKALGNMATAEEDFSELDDLEDENLPF